RLRAVAVCGAAVDLAAVALSAADVHREITRFVVAEPDEFLRQRDEVAAGPQPLDMAWSISPRPLLVVHGSDDERILAADARSLHDRARPPRRYVEVEGANHAFSWHRARLRDLIVGWLDEANV